MLTHLDHVIVAVRDLEAATATYARLLGRSPVWRGQHPGLGTANSLFPLDNAYVELLSPVGEGRYAEPLRTWLEAHGEGPMGLAFGTEDAAACARVWRERGLPAEDPEPGMGRDEQSGARRAWENVFLPTTATRSVLLFAICRRPEDAPLVVSTPPAGPSMQALDHVVIQSHDLDATAALYRDRLGLRLALDRCFEPRRLRILFFRLGGVTLEVVGPLDSEPDPQAPDRLWGLAYRVGDVSSAQRRLAEAGFDVSEVRAGFKPGTRVCTVRGETHGVATLVIGPDEAGA
jgi:catechol 2,3-dioxygenase-like lactoylglutathione lyase family enzyme